MFDAEDLDTDDVDETDSNPLDWDVFSEDEDVKSEGFPDTKSKDKDSTPSADTLSSAASSPDTANQKEGIPSSPSRNRKRKNSRVTWISSESGSARRIPFALQVAHSYTIKKLEMQHYQLVDTATVKKQEAARQQAKLAQLKLQQQYQFYNGHSGGHAASPYAGQQYPVQYHHGGTHGVPHGGHYPPPHGAPHAGGHYRYPVSNSRGPMRSPHGTPHAAHGAHPAQQVHGSHASPHTQAPRMHYMPPQHPRKQDGSEYVTYRAPRTTVSPQMAQK